MVRPSSEEPRLARVHWGLQPCGAGSDDVGGRGAQREVLMRWSWLVWLLWGCGVEGGPPTGTDVRWYENPCGRGDPVERTCVDEADIVLTESTEALCAELGVAQGDPCDDAGALCVLEQGYTCASDGAFAASPFFMICQDDPGDDTMCPQSSRAVKKDIHYVAPGERRALADEVLSVKLARYDYRDPTKPGRRLGYILEDQPNASFSAEGHVDLYAYVSAVVALAQEQQAEIAQLRAELDALKVAPTAP